MACPLSVPHTGMGASCLLPLGWCPGRLKSVHFSASPESGCLYELALTRACAGREGSWVSPGGPPWAHWGLHRQSAPPWFVSRPARGVQEVVSRIHMPLMSSQPRQPLPAPQPRRSPQCSGWMRRPEASLETRRPPTRLVPLPRRETAGRVDLAWH